jgi:hypothetical protein
MTQEEFLIATRKHVAALMEPKQLEKLPPNSTVAVLSHKPSHTELAELIKAVAILEDAQANSNLYKGSRVDDDYEPEEEQW